MRSHLKERVAERIKLACTRSSLPKCLLRVYMQTASDKQYSPEHGPHGALSAMHPGKMLTI